MSYVVDGVGAGVGGGTGAGAGGAEVGLGVGPGVGVGEGLDGMGWLVTRSLLAEGAPGERWIAASDPGEKANREEEILHGCAHP